MTTYSFLQQKKFKSALFFLCCVFGLIMSADAADTMFFKIDDSESKVQILVDISRGINPATQKSAVKIISTISDQLTVENQVDTTYIDRDFTISTPLSETMCIISEGGSRRGY